LIPLKEEIGGESRPKDRDGDFIDTMAMMGGFTLMSYINQNTEFGPTVDQQLHVHQEGWMMGAQETIYNWVPISLTIQSG